MGEEVLGFEESRARRRGSGELGVFFSKGSASALLGENFGANLRCKYASDVLIPPSLVRFLSIFKASALKLELTCASPK